MATKAAASADRKDEAAGPAPRPTADAVELLAFDLAGDRYGCDIARVQEVIRVPPLVRVPLAVPGTAGVASLRGRATPVLDLRVCCGLPPEAPGPRGRVVVVAGRAPLGFIVDLVAGVARLPAGAGTRQNAAMAGAVSTLLEGVVRTADGTVMKVLDVDRLAAGAMLRQAGTGPAGTGTGPAGTGPADIDTAGSGGYGVDAHAAVAPAAVPDLIEALTGDPAENPVGDPVGDPADDLVELVRFAVDGTEYAFRVEDVSQIAAAPAQTGRLSPGDQAIEQGSGLMEWRGRLLPLFSARALLRARGEAAAPDTRVVVLSRGAAEVALTVAHVREVLRVPRERILPWTGTRQRESVVESVCQLGAGALLPVLDADRLLPPVNPAASQAASPSDSAERAANGPEDAAMVPAGETGRPTDPGDSADPGGSAHSAHSADPADPADPGGPGDPLYVVFRLDNEDYGVPVDDVLEVIPMPPRLTQAPMVAAHIAGLVNLRGGAVPVIDLRTRLALPPRPAERWQRIIVLATGGVRTGVIVDAVAEVIPVPRTAMEPVPTLSEASREVVARVAILPRDGRVLLVVRCEGLLAGAEGRPTPPQNGG